MCTIGTVFQKATNGALSFKQCDLIPYTTFYDPEIVAGTGDIRYLPFTRKGSKGCWSGINNYGVSFVAADAYLEPTPHSLPGDTNSIGSTNRPTLKAVSEDIFSAYTSILSEHKTAKDAADYMSQFYQSFGDADILLISDAHSAFFIETDCNKETKQQVIECIERTDGFFASTNHFRMLYQGVLYPNNHSSYLRLARAEAILEKDGDPFDVLRDQYFGETVFSVCRVNKNTPSQEEPYHTQATSIFFTDGKVVNCAYQINGNPRTNTYTYLEDVFGQKKITTGLTHEQVEALLAGSN